LIDLVISLFDTSLIELVIKDVAARLQNVLPQLYVAQLIFSLRVTVSQIA